MRVPLFFFFFMLFSFSGIAAAQVASVMPASCTKREALDPAEYQRLGRFLALGGDYPQWAEKNCYPSRLDDSSLVQTDRPIGYVATIGERDVFIVDLGPNWFSRCTKTATRVSGGVKVDGATQLALHQHLAGLPETASIDLREIGFAEARMRDKTALFALDLATGDRVADVEGFEDLDGAIARAAEQLRGPAAR